MSNIIFASLHQAASAMGVNVTHRVIGEGTFGYVYEAGVTLAYKHFKLRIDDTTVKELFALRLLDGHNIMPTLCCVVLGDEYGYFMDRYDYSLADINVQKHNLETQISVCRQILQKSLYYILELNITNRDIKPSNMVYKDGQIRIVDWGGALHNDIRSGNEHTNKCSYHYRSPEQFTDKSNDSVVKHNPIASEIWSIGMTMLYYICYANKDDRIFELLADKECNQLELLQDSLLHKKVSDIINLKKYPEELVNIINRMLCYNVILRISPHDLAEIPFVEYDSLLPSLEKIPHFSPVHITSFSLKSSIVLNYRQQILRMYMQDAYLHPTTVTTAYRMIDSMKTNDMASCTPLKLKQILALASNFTTIHHLPDSYHLVLKQLYMSGYNIYDEFNNDSYLILQKTTDPVIRQVSLLCLIMFMTYSKYAFVSTDKLIDLSINAASGKIVEFSISSSLKMSALKTLTGIKEYHSLGSRQQDQLVSLVNL